MCIDDVTAGAIFFLFFFLFSLWTVSRLGKRLCFHIWLSQLLDEDMRVVMWMGRPILPLRLHLERILRDRQKHTAKGNGSRVLVGGGMNACTTYGLVQEARNPNPHRQGHEKRQNASRAKEQKIGTKKQGPLRDPFPFAS